MKRALITGANRSIGFEMARQLLQKGYYVYLGSRDLQKGEQAVAVLKSEGLTAVECIEIDVSNKVSVEAASKMVASKAALLDVLVNNAGILGNMPQQPTTTDVDNIKAVFDTNFFGTINVTNAFMGLLKNAPLPVIVNVTSGLASLTLHSDPSWAYYNFKAVSYGPSKTALNAYTIALAYELKDTAFKVNAVDPGYTATDFNHHQGHGTIAAAAEFVLRYATLDADGPTGRFFSHDYEGKDNECPW